MFDSLAWDDAGGLKKNDVVVVQADFPAEVERIVVGRTRIVFKIEDVGDENGRESLAMRKVLLRKRVDGDMLNSWQSRRKCHAH